jgi:hypothetical protein
VSLDVLLLTLPSAELAGELSVEGLQGLSLRFELVRVTFDGLCGDFRVERYEKHGEVLALVA